VTRHIGIDSGEREGGFQAVALERDAFAECLDLLGAERIVGALEAVDVAIRRTFVDGRPAEEHAFIADAHKLISTAAAVGFLDLARACQTFEESYGSGAARGAFESLRATAMAALHEIGRLKVELRATASP